MEINIDIAVGQLVEWLKEDIESNENPQFGINANRTFLVGSVADESAGLSEDDELASMSTVGHLEVKPLGENIGKWLLRIRVEDTIGPHLPEEGSVPDEPEEMTLEAFEKDFILPDRGNAFIILHAETQESKELFDALAADLLTDRHIK
jgi:hypothetical protein